MKMFLIKEDLWDIIEYESEEPKDAVRSSKALASIKLMIEEDQLIHVAEAKGGREAWFSLKEIYMNEAVGHKMRLYKELYNTKLVVGGNMQNHLRDMLNIAKQISDCENNLEENVVVRAILSSLNAEYGKLVTELEAWKEELTIECVKLKLINEWKRRSEKSEVFKDIGSKNRIKCFKCKKKGHIKRNCPMINKEDNNECRDECVMMAKFGERGRRYCDPRDSRWLIDSGASSHMTYSKSFFTKFDESFRGSVTVANGEKVEFIGRGNVQLNVFVGNQKFLVNLTDVLLVPCIDSNLISVPKLVSKGFSVIFDSIGCYLKSDGIEQQQIGEKSGDMYVVTGDVERSCLTQDRVDRCCVHEWHRKLAHRNLHDILAMKGKGLKISDCDCTDVCESCITEKISRTPFPKKSKPVENILDCIVSDICGPMPITSIGGYRYFVTFTDVHSKFCAVYLLKAKSEVQSKVIEYLELLKNSFGRKVKIFRTDRGTEYLSQEVQKYLRSEGIRYQCTVAYSPEQNGISERKNRTLVEACRTMLTESGMSREYWDEALKNANYSLNRVLSKDETKSPYEKFFNMKPDLTNMKEFGVGAYVMIPYQKRKKLDQKAQKMAFVGYDGASKGYRLANINERKIIVARDVVFLKDKFMKSKNLSRNTSHDTNERSSEFVYFPFSSNSHNTAETIENVDENDIFYDAEDSETEIGTDEFAETDVSNRDESSDNAEFEIIDDVYGQDENSNIEISIGRDDHIQEENEEIVQPRVSSRQNKGQKPQRFGDYVTYSSQVNFEPKTYKQAVTCVDAEKWKKAMDEEIKSIKQNNTWDVVKLPKNKRAIGCKWVYKLKRDENGQVCSYKARLVAQGFSQKYGEDYDEVFAPVARSATFRILMSVAGVNNYHVKQFDIKTAFLNGDIEEEIYMKQPPGFANGDDVCKLKKSLYGLKQAARAWNKVYHEAVIDFGFNQSEVDKCLYSLKDGSNVCYMIVHVDDILVASNNERLIEKFKHHIGRLFEVKDMGNVKHFLGIDVKRDDNGNFHINQKQYIETIVEESGLNDGKVSKYPLMTGYFRHHDENYLESNNEYRKLIGKLLYISTNTRPDIAASVGILSQKISKPTKTDLIEVKRVIRYLNGTKNLSLKLSDKKKVGKMQVYSDASWAEDSIDRKSLSGFICEINGGTVTWCSRKQEVVSLSSMEAEYIALSESCKEVKWVKMLIGSFFEFVIPDKITLQTDSQSSMKLITNQKFSNRSKHIDTKYHYVKHLVESGEVELKYCSTDENIADMMTKPLGAIKLKKFTERCGLN
jgi:transposase InsO family protein